MDLYMDSKSKPTLELYHYGTKYHSGRYPYGSGDRPYQHDDLHFYQEVRRLRKEGLTDREIAEMFGMKMTTLRAEFSLAKDRVKAQQRADVIRLLNEGKNKAEIARILSLSPGTVAKYADPELANKKTITESTVDVLKKNFEEYDYLDVGDGTSAGMGITKNRLNTAVQSLIDEGYVVYNIHVEQAWLTGKNTTVQVLCKPGTTLDELQHNRDKIGIVNERFKDQWSPETDPWRPVQSVSSDRVEIAYSSGKDGLIELRRGVEDLDLGESKYSQVRIAVDDTHYIKGVAAYSDDLPDGVDIRFNTNKKKGTPMMSDDPEASQVLKPIKGSLDNPIDAFSTSIKSKGGQSGALNIVYEEGDWGEWKKTIASQVLSKQPTKLARRQLDAAAQQKQVEFDEIKSLTNPVLRANLLTQFADKCDTASVDLKAAAVPRQASHVILPVESLAADEVYAPRYREGETVILIRYPHGGTFEIPELKVTHKNKEADSMMKNARDAVGINPVVAQRLSGADFDGDTVLVIPNNDRSFKTSPAIKGLQDFDPKASYPAYPGMKKMSEEHKQREMGIVTNLICDMTIKDAPMEDIARAVKYSMVVIDAEKHNLNFRQAREDLGINDLKKKYQAHEDGTPGAGASTLISRASSTVRVDQATRSHKPDPDTGDYTWTPTGKTYTKKGKTVKSTMTTQRMRTVDDAYELSSGTAIESAYADYANTMKQMARDARKAAMKSEPLPYDAEQAAKYKAEIASLREKVDKAKSHSPYERKAQLLADTALRLKMDEMPDMSKEKQRKYKAQALAQARASLGGGRGTLEITDREWEAIQSGGVRKSLIEDVLNYADKDEVKQRAMPRDAPAMTPSKIALAKSRIAMGYSLAEIADDLGVSVSTLDRALHE